MSKLPRGWQLYGESEVNDNEVKNNAWIWNSNSEGKESSLKLRWLKTCADSPISRVPITSTYRYIKLFSFPKRQNSNKNLSCDFTRQARLIWWDLVTRFDFIRIYFIRKQDIILFSTNKRGRLGQVHTFPLPPPPPFLYTISPISKLAASIRTFNKLFAPFYSFQSNRQTKE